MVDRSFRAGPCRQGTKVSEDVTRDCMLPVSAALVIILDRSPCGFLSVCACRSMNCAQTTARKENLGSDPSSCRCQGRRTVRLGGRCRPLGHGVRCPVALANPFGGAGRDHGITAVAESTTPSVSLRQIRFQSIDFVISRERRLFVGQHRIPAAVVLGQVFTKSNCILGVHRIGPGRVQSTV